MKKHLFAILIASTLTLGGCSLVAPLSMIDNYRPSTPTSYSTSATPWWISSTTSTPWWISTSESTSTPWWVSTSESTSTPWWISTSEPTSQPTSTPWWVSTSESTYDPWASSESTYDPWASSESTSDSSSPSGGSYEISLDNDGSSKDYPWSYDGYEYKSTNENVDSSESVMRITFKETGTFSFYYMCYCESGCDYLYITHYYYWSGSWGYVLESSASSPDYYDVEVYVEAGDYLEFGYHKDGSVSNYDDCAKITNLGFSYSY